MIPDPYDESRQHPLTGLWGLGDRYIMLPDSHEVPPRFRYDSLDPWVQMVWAWREHGFSRYHGLIVKDGYDPALVIRHLRVLTGHGGLWRPNGVGIVDGTAMLAERWCDWAAYGPLGDRSKREQIVEVSEMLPMYDGFLTEWLDRVDGELRGR